MTMAKAKSSKSEKKKIVLSEEVKLMPRRYRLGRTWVGIGGDIELEVKPPELPRIVKEATHEQYIKIAANCPHLVKVV